jgi:hypothetical protein
MHPKQFAMGALIRSLLKKFHNNEASAERDSAALAKFLEANNTCKAWQPAPFESDLMAVAFGEARDFIWRFCHPRSKVGDESLLSLSNISQGFGFGPGANIGAKTGDLYGKLAISRLTYTDEAMLELFRHTWCHKGLQREQELFRAKHYPTAQVPGNVMSFVPKSSRISRTICTEPILNMFFQKGIASVMTPRLRKVTGIDLRSQQPKNAELARIGSLTGEFGTIDLSSASDTISTALVRYLFPPAMVSWLMLTRSQQVTLQSGDVVDLHMISSMGNAFTFPLQTVIFTSLVVGAYTALDLPLRWPVDGCETAVGNLAVFGDDIIVLERAYNLVLKLLHYCGFTVNHDKSFNSGLFRESCGSDWFSGYNVRGVYIETLLDDMDLYSAYNRLNNWSHRHGIHLDQTLDFLKREVKEILVVPFHEGDEAGFKVPLHEARPVLKWHTDYQAFRYKCAVRKGLSLTIPEVDPVEDWMDSRKLAKAEKALKKIRKLVPGWRYCPAGVLLLLLLGSVRDGRLALRVESRDTEIRWRLSSCWDSAYTPAIAKLPAGYRGLNSAIATAPWRRESNTPL